MVRREFLEGFVSARQVRGDDTLLTYNFFHRFAGVGRDHLPRGFHEVGGSNERLRQIHGIVDHRGQGKIVAVADPVFDQLRLVATRYAVAANPAVLQVRGCDDQDVALPLAGRESLPSVWGVRGRMRSTIHIDRALWSLPRNVGVPGDQLLRRGIDFLPDPQICGAAWTIIGRVGLALMFRQGEQGGVPRVGAKSCRVGDGET